LGTLWELFVSLEGSYSYILKITFNLDSKEAMIFFIKMVLHKIKSNIKWVRNLMNIIYTN